MEPPPVNAELRLGSAGSLKLIRNGFRERFGQRLLDVERSILFSARWHGGRTDRFMEGGGMFSHPDPAIPEAVAPNQTKPYRPLFLSSRSCRQSVGCTSSRTPLPINPHLVG
jgi:hypothetical protein